MDLRDFIRVARKRWWMIAGSVVLTVALGALVTVRTPAQYATSVTFFITTPNSGVTDAYQGGLFSQQRVKSYASLLTGDRLAGAVAAHPEIGLTASQLRGRITANAVPETVLLAVVVTDRDAQRSKRTAVVLADEFKKMVETLETPPGAADPSVKVDVVAGPSLAPDPVSPRPLRNGALAVLLGLVLGAVLTLLRELLDTAVSTSEALQQLAGAPVLATVPLDNDTRTGVPLAIGAGHSPRAEALRQLRTNLQYVNIDRRLRIVVVTSAVP
ncbi:MAG TPA: Wzz/FepE/Etk N-terminal domain-containing protein, partial [Actinoplanes sp.]|nr:Wzz/FepE/Etk N-terminal domain-containing protein [Actinoplanes sp.]